MPRSPMRSITALRRAARSLTRSRCHDAGGAGATFQTPASAPKQEFEKSVREAPKRHRRQLSARRGIIQGNPQDRGTGPLVFGILIPLTRMSPRITLTLPVLSLLLSSLLPAQ